MRLLLMTILVLLAGVGDAVAYVGPGLGLGAIGAFLGAVLAVLLGILGVFWYPLKRLIRKLRSRSDNGRQDRPQGGA